MSILAILEVAIGMIFAWLVMSLAGMYIQEWIVSKLAWRSNMLQLYIGNLMSDASLARQLYDHQLIKALHSGFDRENLPSYIPSAQFSLVLVDIIRNASKEAALIQETLYALETDISQLSKSKQELAQQELDAALELTRKAIASDGGPEITNPIMDEVKKQIRKLSTDYPELQARIEARFLAFATQKKQVDGVLAEMAAKNNGAAMDTPQSQFQAGMAVMSVTHPDLKQAIDALVSESNPSGDKSVNTLQQVRIKIEEWFNNSMDRLSGWYKRRAQTLAFIIGISIAILLNVDSMQLATQLWRDPSVRQALAAQADALVNRNPNGLPDPNAGQLVSLANQISQLNVPVGWIGSSLPVDASGLVSVGDITSTTCTLAPRSNLELFGIHVGNQCYPIINTPQFNDLTGWLLKLVGLLITGTAASQGAPFWFDILKNVVNVRMAGANSDLVIPKTAK
jgi:hypothetical protein